MTCSANLPTACVGSVLPCPLGVCDKAVSRGPSADRNLSTPATQLGDKCLGVGAALGSDLYQAINDHPFQPFDHRRRHRVRNSKIANGIAGAWPRNRSLRPAYVKRSDLSVYRQLDLSAAYRQPLKALSAAPFRLFEPLSNFWDSCIFLTQALHAPDNYLYFQTH